MPSRSSWARQLPAISCASCPEPLTWPDIMFFVWSRRRPPGRSSLGRSVILEKLDRPPNENKMGPSLESRPISVLYRSPIFAVQQGGRHSAGPASLRGMERSRRFILHSIARPLMVQAGGGPRAYEGGKIGFFRWPRKPARSDKIRARMMLRHNTDQAATFAGRGCSGLLGSDTRSWTDLPQSLP